MTCIACQSSDVHAFVSTGHISLYRCGICGSLTALPRPNEASLLQYHDAGAYFEHPYFEARRRDVERLDARCRDVYRRLETAAPGLSLDGKRHLDVGCDTGLFLERFARLHGTQPHGVEINTRAAAIARTRGIDVQHTVLAGADLSGFDLVTLIDVIEHVADPIGLLAEVRSRLRPNGLVYLETPNIDSTIYATGRRISQLTGGRPASLCERLFLPEHVQYFSSRGLDVAAQRSGLRTLVLTRRCLTAADINSHPVVVAGVMALQAADRFSQREILHCAVLAASLAQLGVSEGQDR